MERETKTLTTPSGIEVVTYIYLNGKEARDMQRILLAGVPMDDITPEGLPKNIPVTTMMDVQELLLKTLVVSYAGSKENVFDRVMNAEGHDTEFVINEVTEVWKGWVTKKK